MSEPLASPDAAHRIRTVTLAVAALVAMLALRLTGPSDVYDQTQPKTIAYTTDILVNGGGRWMLPMERGEIPATKPPLYNWLAAPAVRVLGFHSEIGHKLPSIAAMLACWAILIRLGYRIEGSGRLGALAAVCFVTNYATFKLGFLARPDMLLTLFLLTAWVSATAIVANTRSSRVNHLGIVAVFWISVAGSALTKGPVAVIALLHAALCVITMSRWSAFRGFRPIVGAMFALMVFAAWVFAVWQIDSEHLHRELWFNEIYGRLTGTGAEGTRGGTRELFSELHYQTFYFLTRFAPWSLASVYALAVLAGPRKWMHWFEDAADDGNSRDGSRIWMQSAAIFLVLTVALFSLSVGKRADYIAVAVPQASLLAAWALLRLRPRVAIKASWSVALASALSLAVLSFYDHRQIWAPQPGFGDAIRRFIDSSSAHIAANPAPVLNVSAGQSHMQAMLGISAADQRSEIVGMIEAGKPFWVIAGRTQHPPHEFDEWIVYKRWNAEVRAVVRSEELPRAEGWPGLVTLYRVTPQ